MALENITIIKIAMVILVINILVLLLIKNGITKENSLIYGTILIFIFIFTLINYIFIWEKYLLMKVACVFIVAILLCSLAIKKKNFHKAKRLLVIAILINLFFFIF